MTTSAKDLLPASLKIIEFVNADEIARGLSPFNPEAMALQKKLRLTSPSR